MIGSVCYSLSSFVYLMLVTRLCGVDQGGVFALAYSTSQLLLTFGRFGMRTYQATDTRGEYSFAEYGYTRIITCLGMVLLSLPYCLFMRYSKEKILIFLLVTAFKMTDAAEDVYHGELQRNFHVAVMGKTLAARNVFSCLVFGLCLFLSRDLILTCAVSCAASLTFCILVNSCAVKKYCKKLPSRDTAAMKRLFVLCFPIFISTFLSLLLYNVPKYAIDYYLSEADQAFYNIMFMPSFVITLFSEIITKPMLTRISVQWEEDKGDFKRTVGRIFLLILAAAVFVTAAGHLLGRRLLELFYGVSLEPYKLHFVVLLIGGGLSAAVYITYNILIAIRYQKVIVLVYLLVAAIAIPLTYRAVGRWGLWGACWSYLGTCLVLELLFASLLLGRIRREGAS